MGKKATTEKLSITLPRDLLGEIKEMSPEGGVSGFLRRAAQQYIAQERFLNAIELGYGAWKEENHPDLITPEDTVAFVRRLREDDDKVATPKESPNAS